MGERLTAETIDQLRMWTLCVVAVCASLIIGLSNAVWTDVCSRIHVLHFFGAACSNGPGTTSQSMVSFGDGVATAIVASAILGTCFLALVFKRSSGMWMTWATLIALVPLTIAGGAAAEYYDEGTITIWLKILTVISVATPILTALYVWLDVKHEQATTTNGDNAWA